MSPFSNFSLYRQTKDEFDSPASSFIDPGHPEGNYLLEVPRNARIQTNGAKKPLHFFKVGLYRSTQAYSM